MKAPRESRLGNAATLFEQQRGGRASTKVKTVEEEGSTFLIERGAGEINSGLLSQKKKWGQEKCHPKKQDYY